MSQKAIESSGDNEWETPLEIFAHWNKLFNFDMDVAASDSNHKVSRYLTKETTIFDLKNSFGERNWMNPPYCKPELACKSPCTKKTCVKRGHCVDRYQPGLRDFIGEAAARSSLFGVLVVALIPVATATEWWQGHVKKADHVFYYPHRINFLQNGIEVKGVAFDPCVVFWGLHPNRTKGCGDI